MISNNDPTSLLLLVLGGGKDNPWLPYILLALWVLQKWSTIQTFLLRLLYFRRTEYKIEGKFYVNKKYASQYGTLPEPLLGILSYMQEKNIDLPKSINLNLNDISGLEALKECRLPAEGRSIELVPHIRIAFHIQRANTSTDDSEDSGESSTSRYTVGLEEIQLIVHVTSWKPNDYIRNFLDTCVKAYKTRCTQESQKQLILQPFPVTSPLGNHDYMDVHRYRFESNKTFDNVFFDGKQDLLRRLDDFMSDASPLVTRMGLPQTLGFLFWGEPGTGKTSVIKAIANYTGRSLVQIPMNKIKTRRALEDILQGSWMTDTVPHARRIYVFEEIDCSGWDEIVRDRRLPPLQTKDQTAQVTVIGASADSLLSSRKKRGEEEERLTLGSLLEILDGIVETPGRMLIMTTNHRDILDPALTRPGRIDMEIEFKRLRRPHIQQIYQRMFGISIKPQVYQQIPDYRYTQAELSQLLYQHSRDSDAFLQALLSRHSTAKNDSP